MTDEVVENISKRYIELFEVFTGNSFVKSDYKQALQRIEQSVEQNIFSLKD
jgi:phosphoribosylaminoimidazole-succinocarboxamide synthase